MSLTTEEDNNISDSNISLNKTPNNTLLQKACFYRKYHSHPINILIHIFFVPLLLWTGLSIGNYIHFSIPLLASIGYGSYYIYLDKLVGSTYLPILFLMYFTMDKLTLLEAVLIHVLSWIVQISAHKYVEKKSPALLIGFWDALTIAPLFVWLEIWWFFGYNPIFYKLLKYYSKVE